jgi:hypothetical protein
LAGRGALLDVSKCFLEERNDVLVIQRIHTLAPSPLDHHQRVLTEDSELMRNRGLLHPEPLHQLRYDARPFEKTREYLHSARRRESEHRVRNLLSDTLADAR